MSKGDGHRMLPPAITNAAFAATNGEVAWQRPDVAAAVHAIAEQQWAILGGEVWIVRAGQITAGPLLQDGQRAVIHWSSTQAAGEAWAQFVQRAATETLAAIDGLQVEVRVVPQDAAHVYYNLTFVTEIEYAELAFK